MRPLAARALGAVTILSAAVVVLAAIAPEGRALAHAVGVSSGEYRLDGKVLYGDLGMANRELARLLPAIDTNFDGLIAAEELAAGHDALVRAIAGGVTVQADGTACSGSLDRAWVTEEDGGAVFQLRYACAAAPGRLTLAMPILAGLAPGHRHMARLFRAGKAEVTVLDGAHATWTLGGAHASSNRGGIAWSTLKLGVEHILTGWDHLLFLLGLILVGGRARALVGVVSAFTLAHSITLALAALSVFAPSPRFVEPAIALSIVYVGVENLFVKDARKRWRITFLFGLVHGFGFAGALREIALPRGQVPVALVSFNLGVELGQLAVLLVALPLTLTVRNASWFGDRGIKALSVAISVAGGVLFISRLAGQ